MHQVGQEVCSRTNYILATDSCLFHNVAVRDASRNTDHYLVLGCLLGAAPAAHSNYIGKRTRLPIRPQSTPYKADRMFSKPRRAIPRSP